MHNINGGFCVGDILLHKEYRVCYYQCMNPRIDTSPEHLGSIIDLGDKTEHQLSIPRNIIRAAHSLTHDRRQDLQEYNYNRIDNPNEIKPQSPLDEIDRDDFKMVHLYNRLGKRQDIITARKRKIDGLQYVEDVEVIKNKEMLKKQKAKLEYSLKLYISDIDKLIKQKQLYLQTLEEAANVFTSGDIDEDTVYVPEDQALAAYRLIFSKVNLPPRYTPKHADSVSVMDIIIKINTETADLYAQLEEYKIEIAIEEAVLVELAKLRNRVSTMYTNRDALAFYDLCENLIDISFTKIYPNKDFDITIANKIKTKLMQKMYQKYFVQDVGVVRQAKVSPRDDMAEAGIIVTEDGVLLSPDTEPAEPPIVEETQNTPTNPFSEISL